MDLLQDLVTFDETQRLTLAGILRNRTFIDACNFIIRKEQPNPHEALKLTPEARAAKFTNLGGMTLMLSRLASLSKPDSPTGVTAQEVGLGWDDPTVDTDLNEQPPNTHTQQP